MRCYERLRRWIDERTENAMPSERINYSEEEWNCIMLQFHEAANPQNVRILLDMIKELFGR